jgi:hypothetical protein
VVAHYCAPSHSILFGTNLIQFDSQIRVEITQSV